MKKSQLVLFGLIIVVICFVSWKLQKSKKFYEDLQENLKVIKEMGTGGYSLLIITIAILTTCAVSFGVFELPIAFIFDPIVAYAIIFLGRTLGAIGSFLVANNVHFLKKTLRNWVMKNEFIKSFEEIIKESPYKYCFLLRIMHLPCSVRNYGIPLLGVNFLCFFITLFAEQIPYTFLKVYLGTQVKQTMDAIHIPHSSVEINYVSHGITVVTILLIVVITKSIYSSVKRKQNEKEKSKNGKKEIIINDIEGKLETKKD
jgi:uncharacterized membrane protein YdjX (TVP38/TMEM64 family)